MFTTTLSLSWRLASTITSTSFSIPTAPACFATGLCAQRLATLVDEVSFKLFHYPLIFFFCPPLLLSTTLLTSFSSTHLDDSTLLPHPSWSTSSTLRSSSRLLNWFTRSSTVLVDLEEFVNSDDEEFITHESDSATSSYGEDDSYSSSATSSSPPSPLFESEGKFDASPIDYLDLALQAGPPSSIPEAIDSPPSPTLSLPVLEVSSIPSFELIPELAAKMVIAFPRSSRPFTHNIRLYQDVDYSSSEASSSRSTLEISSLPIIDFNIEFVPETVLEPIIPLLGSFQTPISTTTTGPITATTLF